jgi:hypothetical protein
MEPLGRTSEAQLRQIVAQNVARALKQRASRRQRFTRLPTHPDRLRPLTGKQQRDFQDAASFGSSTVRPM